MTKVATLETGMEIRVPLFIKEGEKIKVHTETREFAGRAMIPGDLRHAWRSIVRMPVLAAVVVVSLGVGIGVNTAVFSWVQAMFLQPLPGVAGRRRAVPRRTARRDRARIRARRGSNTAICASGCASLPDLLAFRMVPFNVGEPGRVERTYGLLVSGNYFSALGLRRRSAASCGRTKLRRPAASRSWSISHDYWQTRFGGAASVLGPTIRVNDLPLTVIGVAPERFQGTVLS